MCGPVTLAVKASNTDCRHYGLKVAAVIEVKLNAKVELHVIE
jgi:hypothetical protein